MAITVRQGLDTDYDPSKLVSGEFAAVTDTKELYIKILSEALRIAMDKDVPDSAQLSGNTLKLKKNGVELFSVDLSNLSIDSGTDLELDDTLSQTGKAADAGAVGERMEILEQKIEQGGSQDVEVGEITYASGITGNKNVSYLRKSGNVVFCRISVVKSSFGNMTDTRGKNVATIPENFAPTFGSYYVYSFGKEDSVGKVFGFLNIDKSGNITFTPNEIYSWKNDSSYLSVAFCFVR